jgi:hypothetical protein
MAALGSGDEGGSAEAVGKLRVGARIDGEPQDIQQPFRAGIQKGIIQAVIADVDIRACLDERAHGFYVVAVRGCHDWRTATRVAPIDIGAFTQPSLNGGAIAVFRGADEWIGHFL